MTITHEKNKFYNCLVCKIGQQTHTVLASLKGINGYTEDGTQICFSQFIKKIVHLQYRIFKNIPFLLPLNRLTGHNPYSDDDPISSTVF